MIGWISSAWRELIGLFIDDGSFAAAILAWLAGGVISIHVFAVPPVVEGFILAAGVALVLAENVERSARTANKENR
jgi:hypothetical protein